MKKTTSLVLTLCLVFSLLIPCTAFAESSTRSFPTGQYGVVVVKVNGRNLEVPAVSDVGGISRSADGTLTSTQTIFVPMGTEEALDRNAQLVSEIKEYGSPRTRGYGDFYDNGYMWFHSTLNYTTTTRNDVPYFDLISFKLEREVYVESVYKDFNNASAHVMQIGAAYNGGSEPLTQEKSYDSIVYNSLYSLPSAWVPVYNVGYFIGVEYSVDIEYTPNLGLTDYKLTYVHQAV